MMGSLQNIDHIVVRMTEEVLKPAVSMPLPARA
jgi:hypothetical protein